MSEKEDLREQTNPVFNTAMAWAFRRSIMGGFSSDSIVWTRATPALPAA